MNGELFDIALTTDYAIIDSDYSFSYVSRFSFASLASFAVNAFKFRSSFKKTARP